MKPAAIQAEFTDYRPVKTRKTLQLIFEVPAEQQAAVFEALGYPIMGTSTWVAIARMATEAAPLASDPERRERKRSEIAAIKCNDAEFQVWLATRCPDEWDANYYVEKNSAAAATATVKDLLGIKSRTELDSDPAKAAAWDALLTDFDMRNTKR